MSIGNFAAVVALSRRCARPACSGEAVASMSYDYGARRVELGPLAAVRHPTRYDLCARHAEVLSPPRGWVVEIAGDTPVTIRSAAIGRGVAVSPGQVSQRAVG